MPSELGPPNLNAWASKGMTDTALLQLLSHSGVGSMPTRGVSYMLSWSALQLLALEQEMMIASKLSADMGKLAGRSQPK